MKNILWLLLLPLGLFAQESHLLNKELSKEEQAILKPVLQIFDGMRAGDGALVADAFTAEVSMFTSFSDSTGSPQLRKGDVQRFVDAVNSEHDAVWDEPIWNIQIQHSDNLATVWTDYAFYLGKQLLHCGVDAFTLAKQADGSWKIFHLTDTRRTKGCAIPPALQHGR